MFTTNKTSKIAVTTATLILAVSLTACSNSAEPIPSATDSPSPTAPVEPTVEPTAAPEPTVEPKPEDMPSEHEDMFTVTGIDAIADRWGADLADALVPSFWEVNSLGWGGAGMRDLHKPYEAGLDLELAEVWFKDLMTAEAWDRFSTNLVSDDKATAAKAKVILPAVEADGRIGEVDGVTYYVDESATAPFRALPTNAVHAWVTEGDRAAVEQDSIMRIATSTGEVVVYDVKVSMGFVPGASEDAPWLLESWSVTTNNPTVVESA